MSIVRGKKYIDELEKCSKPRSTGYGTDLLAGNDHYRAYVGPARDYDIISAMTFNLLTSVGLRQNHKLLDVGCGSLRMGRLLIPYLNEGNYFGVEPNEWLVSDGVKNEVGVSQIDIKNPTFSFAANLNSFPKHIGLDYAFAQSIFSHCGVDLILDWLNQISFHLKDTGALFATFLKSEVDFNGSGWIYPGCVRFLPSTMEALAAKAGFSFKVINWSHPRQSWAVFYKENFNTSSNEIIW